MDYEALVTDPESHANAWQVRQPMYRRSAGRARRYERFLGPLREALGELPQDG